MGSSRVGRGRAKTTEWRFIVLCASEPKRRGGLVAGTYDVIIVGAGSTGGALAARLSGDPAHTGLVLLGGPAYSSTAEMPPELLSPASI